MSEEYNENVVELAQETLEVLMDKMGMEVEFEITEDDETVNVSIEGEDASYLVGKKGKTLDAIQLLVNKMIGRNGKQKLVTIDADRYRERREASLIDLANRLADKALDEGKMVRLNPMSARDRRIVHMTLRNVKGLETKSEGEGDDRQLIIVPV